MLLLTSGRNSPEMETSGPTDFRGTHSKGRGVDQLQGKEWQMSFLTRDRVFRTLLYESAGENKSTQKPNSRWSDMRHQNSRQSDSDIYHYDRRMAAVRGGRAYRGCTPIITYNYYNDNNVYNYDHNVAHNDNHDHDNRIFDYHNSYYYQCGIIYSFTSPES